MAIHSSVHSAKANSILPLEQEIEAYESRQAELEKEHHGEFVVFHEASLAGLFPTFAAAVKEAIRRFDRGPYLIRQIGAPTTLDPTTSVHISAAR